MTKDQALKQMHVELNESATVASDASLVIAGCKGPRGTKKAIAKAYLKLRTLAYRVLDTQYEDGE